MGPSHGEDFATAGSEADEIRRKSLDAAPDRTKMVNTVNGANTMQFAINAASRRPIYQQVVQQVREAIARGDLKPREQLPSVRQLSRDLVINPNTVARAYTELEREGLLTNRPGRGVFVAEPRDERTAEARRRRLLEAADRLLTEAVHLGFGWEEVERLVADRSREFRWNAAQPAPKPAEGPHEP